MVYLLPEEHLFIHKLRYKAFNKREDMLSVRYIINGLNNLHERHLKKGADCLRLSKEIRNSFAFIKQNSAEFRKKHGWQTKKGKESISKHRKNKIPVINKEGESMGCVTKDHPKYISGEWFHHSKGLVPVIEKNSNRKLMIKTEEYADNKHLYIRRGSDNSGVNNPRYINVTDEEIIEEYLKCCDYVGFILKYDDFLKISKLKNSKYKKCPSITSFRFGGNINNLYDIIKNKRPNMFFASKKGYTKMEKEKYFNKKAPGAFIDEKIKEGVFQNDKD